MSQSKKEKSPACTYALIELGQGHPDPRDRCPGSPEGSGKSVPARPFHAMHYGVCRVCGAKMKRRKQANGMRADIRADHATWDGGKAGVMIPPGESIMLYGAEVKNVTQYPLYLERLQFVVEDAEEPKA